MTEYIDPLDEDGKTGFERLKKEILRRERMAKLKKGIAWAVSVATALIVIYYLL